VLLDPLSSAARDELFEFFNPSAHLLHCLIALNQLTHSDRSLIA